MHAWLLDRVDRTADDFGHGPPSPWNHDRSRSAVVVQSQSDYAVLQMLLLPSLQTAASEVHSRAQHNYARVGVR